MYSSVLWTEGYVVFLVKVVRKSDLRVVKKESGIVWEQFMSSRSFLGWTMAKVVEEWLLHASIVSLRSWYRSPIFILTQILRFSCWQHPGFCIRYLVVFLAWPFANLPHREVERPYLNITSITYTSGSRFISIRTCWQRFPERQPHLGAEADAGRDKANRVSFRV